VNAVIDAMKHLAFWLKRHRIDPTKLRIVIEVESLRDADALSAAIAEEGNDYQRVPSLGSRIREGRVCGLRFRVDERTKNAVDFR
jgi:hypothetical protein